MDHLSVLKKRADELERELGETRTAIKVIERLERNAGLHAPVAVNGIGVATSGHIVSATQLLCEILADGPKQKQEIKEAVAARGVKLADNTVNSTLSQKKKLFRSEGNGLWALIPHPSKPTNLP